MMDDIKKVCLSYRCLGNRSIEEIRPIVVEAERRILELINNDKAVRLSPQLSLRA